MNPRQPRIPKETSSADTPSHLIAVKSNASYIQLCSMSRVTSFQFPGKVLSILEKHNIPIFFMVASSTNLSIVANVSEEEFAKVRPLFTPFAQLTFEQNISVIAVTRKPRQTAASLERQIIESLSHIPVLMISHDNSSHSLFLAVYDKHLQQATACLHKLLF